jgi:glycosyltransferase involved in cell wall biosynthesis
MLVPSLLSGWAGGQARARVDGVRRRVALKGIRGMGMHVDDLARAVARGAGASVKSQLASVERERLAEEGRRLRSRLRVLMISHHRRSRAFDRPHALARALVQRGHEVSLIVTSDTERRRVIRSEWDGVRVIETPDLLWGRLRSGWDVWGLMNRVVCLWRKEQVYDIVHCFETRPATIYPALFYCNRHKVPMVTDWNDWWGRGGIIDEVRPKWYRILFGAIETYYEEAFRGGAAGLTVISAALGQRAIGLGVSPSRILHVPGGAFPELYEYRSKETCRKRVGFPVAAHILGFSSLESHLDLEMVMQALAIVAEKYPSVQLIITGSAGKAIHNLARKHGVERNVYFTGLLPLEELPWYLGCADVFVLPFPGVTYNLGRWPNKIGDYMSLGRPTVSNPVGDIRPLFENHDIGLLAEWDPMDFSRKIIYLLDNPRIAARLGKNARELAVTRFDWPILTRELEGFYYRVLDARDQPEG